MPTTAAPARVEDHQGAKGGTGVVACKMFSVTSVTNLVISKLLAHRMVQGFVTHVDEQVILQLTAGRVTNQMVVVEGTCSVHIAR